MVGWNRSHTLTKIPQSPGIQPAPHALLRVHTSLLSGRDMVHNVEEILNQIIYMRFKIIKGA